ncbi:MAG: Asp-tRNA(Asn)/Glu-tRNA(Gln) amidotransferase subunit GatC [Planctomycetota bacterium]|nr:Asp-tRNA(Asn)/Glu-tRNA(Gln) amidotransferase subunit GatC [Planctomycetota bacterium]MDP6839624.1 Asp-tRNA(Asn)/Glu-tRNA(Gln) amidotransferase subunit GatC [Planctomycetota bacterium]MDP6956750.1 Asp-tRNA(Asn)/Glu-tRNA(Gln) amidotransferase subunit GatC [Planctomycetota bacterium]
MESANNHQVGPAANAGEAGPPGDGQGRNLVELVQRTAALARLELSAPELEEMAAQFGRILEQFAVLSELDVDAVEPVRGRAREQDVTRGDTVTPSLAPEKLLERAPQVEDGFYAVPKTVLRAGAEHDKGGSSALTPGEDRA